MNTKAVDVPIQVVVGPLHDDTDFKSLETGVAYNAAGMSVDLIQLEENSSTKTDITLTTAGANDWVELGNGMYSIEITAAQNNKRGQLQVVGVATGIAPFASPVYEVGGGEENLMIQTTIATLASQTSFTLTAGSADNDAYNNQLIVVRDAASPLQVAYGRISDYVGSTKTVTLDVDPAIFTMAVGDVVKILAVSVSNVGIQLDAAGAVTVAGYTGTADFNTLMSDNIGALTATEISDALRVDTLNEISSIPAANAAIATKLGFLAALSRNKVTQTSTTQTLRNDGDTVSIGTATVSDDGTTTTRGKWA